MPTSPSPPPSQDLPPKGGFGPIAYKRHLPKRGPPGWLLITGGFATVITGLLLHAKGTRILKELEREKRQARLMLMPLLLAEADQQYLQKVGESRAIESQLMSDIPGWQVGRKVYSSDRFVPETFFLKEVVL